MDFRRFIGRLLAVLVVAGVALAPAAVQAASLGSPSDMSMSADMPCCPDEQKSKDCQDCPLVAMCILKTVQAGPTEAAAIPLRHAIRTTHLVADEIIGDGLTRPPPDQPPRILA